MVLQFGKYKGCDIKSVPDDYLAWLIDTRKAELEGYQAEQARRQSLQEAQLPWGERLVKAGFRSLSMRYHPDHGGTSEDMRQVVAANERLKELLEESGWDS